jgi:hypothetical protein
VGNYTVEMHLANLKRDIEQAKNSGLKLNATIIGSKCCSECDKIDGSKFPFEQILQKPILPYHKCLRKPFCICCYGFEPLRDENQKLIETKY